MCTLWATQPDAAWKEFRVSAEASQFTRMNFDVFMALCLRPVFLWQIAPVPFTTIGAQR